MEQLVDMAPANFPALQLRHELTPASGEYLPASQAEHVSESALEYVPARQVVQELAPALERVPASHVTQADDPAPERLPATQAEHVSESALEYVPARQVVQELAPALEREPASHVTQAVASCLEHLPTLHTEHVSTDEAPVATECVPAVQLLVHAVTPVSVENFPAAQSTQTTTDEAPWTVGGGRDSRLGSQPRRSRVARFAVEDKKKGVVVPKALKALEKILAARAAALEATRSAEAARFVESGVIFSAALAKVAPPQPPPQPPPRPQPQP